MTLSHNWRQAIISTDAGLLSNETLGNKFQWSFNHDTKLFIHENASEYICEMEVILSREDELSQSTDRTSFYT